MTVQTESPRIHTKRASIRRARFEDYRGIAAVEVAHGLLPKSREEWVHLWSCNPAYRQLDDWPIGWVVEEESGKIVGSIGNIPCFYELGGRQYLAACGRGWVVDQRFRALSLALLMKLINQPGVDLYLTTTAGVVATFVFERLGWARVPVGKWDCSALWIASYEGLVRGYLASKTPRCLTNVIRSPSMSRIAAENHAKPRDTENEPLRLNWCTRFDERFDGFWEELRSRGNGVLLSVRTKEVLEWHYNSAFQQNRIWIVTACRENRLCAFAVFERRPTRFACVSRLLLLDFQSVEQDGNLCRRILEFALARCRRERIPVIENPGCWFERTGLLERRAPHHRNLPCWSYLYMAPNRDLRVALQGASSWHPTSFDGDASL